MYIQKIGEDVKEHTLAVDYGNNGNNRRTPDACASSGVLHLPFCYDAITRLGSQVAIAGKIMTSAIVVKSITIKGTAPQNRAFIGIDSGGTSPLTIYRFSPMGGEMFPAHMFIVIRMPNHNTFISSARRIGSMMGVVIITMAAGSRNIPIIINPIMRMTTTVVGDTSIDTTQSVNSAAHPE